MKKYYLIITILVIIIGICYMIVTIFSPTSVKLDSLMGVTKVPFKSIPSVPFPFTPSLTEPESSVSEESSIEVDIDEPDFVLPNTTPLYFSEVPLSPALQETIINECFKYSLLPEYIFGIICRETNYGQYKATHSPEKERYEYQGDQGRSFGIMQIQERYVQEEMLLLGCEDLCDNFDNVRVGIHIFYCHYEWAYKHWPNYALECAIMAYNRGQGGTLSWIARHGVINVKNYSYVNSVLAEANRILAIKN